MRLFIGQLGIFAVLLILVDAVLGLIAPTPVDDTMADYSMVYIQDLPGVKPKIKYTSFNGGLRSLTMTKLEPAKQSLRVLCLGASTTDQGHQEIQDTWCAIIEKQLKKKHPGWQTAFHTLSYGRAGTKALDTLVWLKKRFDDIKPDIVITLLGINDLAWNGGPGYVVRDVDAAIAGRLSRPDQKSILGRAKLLCKQSSELCRRAARAWKSFQLSKSLTGSGAIEWLSSNLPRLRAEYRALPSVDKLKRAPDPIKEFEASLHRMLKFLQNRDVDAIVLGQPTVWKPNLPPSEQRILWFPVNTPNGFVRPSPRWLLSEMQRYNAVQGSIAAKFTVKFVDLDAKISKDLKHYLDDCHFTDQGSRAVAEHVAPVLEQIIADRLKRSR